MNALQALITETHQECATMTTVTIAKNDAEVKTKFCTGCGETKPVTEFHPRSCGVNGYRSHCKVCWYAENRAASNACHHRKNIEDPERYRANRSRAYERARGDFLGCIRAALHVRKRQCEEKGIFFSITAEDVQVIYERQGGMCSLTGRTLLWGLKGRHRDTLSMDRIKASLGYVPENIRLVTYQVNRARSDLSDTQLFRLCHLVLSNSGETVLRNEFGDDDASVPVAEYKRTRTFAEPLAPKDMPNIEELL